MAEVSDSVSDNNAPTQTDSILPQAPDIAVPKFGGNGRQSANDDSAPVPSGTPAPPPDNNIQPVQTPPPAPSEPAPQKVQAPDVSGVEKMQTMRDAGFSDDEIGKWRDDAQSTMLANGFSAQEVKDYFGQKDPDTSPLKALATGNLSDINAANPERPNEDFMTKLKGALGGLEHDIESGVQVGYQGSTTGLAIRRKMPEATLPSDADRVMKIAATLSQAGVDLPLMGLSGLVTTAVTGGNPIAGGAGAFAAPATLRKIMIDHYQKGDITTPGEFADRAVSTAWEAIKGGATGAATSFLGPIAGQVGGSMAQLGTELAAMTTVSKGLEGQLPRAQDFIDGAITLGAFHGAMGAASILSPEMAPKTEAVPGGPTNVLTKLQNIFVKTATHPADVVQAAMADPIAKQEMLSSNPDLPLQANTTMDHLPVDPEHPGVKPFPAASGEGAQPTEQVSVPAVDRLNEDIATHEQLLESARKDLARSTELQAHFEGEKERLSNADPESEPSLEEARAAREAVNERAAGRDAMNDNHQDMIDSLQKEVDQHPSMQGNVRSISGPHPEVQALQDQIQQHQDSIDANNTATEQERSQTAKDRSDDARKNAIFQAGLSSDHYSDAVDQHTQNIDTIQNRLKILKAQRDAATPGGTDAGEPPTDSGAPDDKEPSVVPPPAKLKMDAGDNFKTKTIDGLNPVKIAVDQLTNGEGVGASKDPYINLRQYIDWQGKLERTYTYNTLDFDTGKPNGEGLLPIMKDVPKLEGELSEHDNKVLEQVDPTEMEGKNDSWKGLTSYLLSRRAVELNERGIETGIDNESAKQVVAAGADKYEDVASRLTDFQNRMADYARKAGLLSDESYEALTDANQKFVPFYRLQEDDPFTGAPPQGGGTGKGFARIQGSESLLLDPIESIEKNTAAIFRRAEQNRALKNLVDLNNSKPMEDQILRPVEPKSRPINISQEEIAKFLTDQGVDSDSIPNEGMQVWRGDNANLKDNEFQIYRDGKREVYATYPELADALNSIRTQPKAVDLTMTLAKIPAQALRAGTVLNPAFMVSHFIRSNIVAGIQSSYGQIPFFDSVMSLRHIIGKDEVYQEFLSSGGGNGSFMRIDKMIKSDPWGLSAETGGWANKTWNLVRSPLHALSLVSELADNATRLAEFKKAGGADPEASLDQKVAAGQAARDVTLDYQRLGSGEVLGMKLAAVKQIVPFMNVGIQGLSRIAESFQEKPLETSIKAIASITAPSVMLWAANRNDPRYQNAPDWEKDLYWLVPTDKWEPANGALDAQSREPGMSRQMPDGSWQVNNGTVYRIPKPFEMGVMFGSMTERILSAYFDKNPDAFKDFAGTLVHGFVPNIMPTVATPVLEQASNHNFFSGKPIVNDANERLLPSYQYTPYTSETAKQLGKFIGAVGGDNIGPKQTRLSSPLVIENYIRDWTGTMGSYALQLGDAALRKAHITPDIPKPPAALADTPFVKSFVMRYPSAGMQNVVNFDDKNDDLKRIQATVMNQAKQGNFDAAQALSKAAVADGKIPGGLSGVSTSLSKMNAFIQQTMQNSKMSSSDKGQLIDATLYQMSKTATMGNKIIEEQKKALKGVK